MTNDMPDDELSALIDRLGDNDVLMRRVADRLLGGANPAAERLREGEIEQVRSVVYALATAIDEGGQ